MSCSWTLLCLLTVVRSAEAIQQSMRSVEKSARQAPIKQVLENIDDMVYIGDITVGGEHLRAVFDTGSFELVIFGQECNTCGGAVGYNDQESTTFKHGTLTKVIAYGSGSCNTKDGFDDVAVESLHAHNQAFWQATLCKMPMLETAAFNAIVGIGPPGMALLSLESELSYLKNRNSSDFMIYAVEGEIDIEKKKSALVDSLGVSTFSACFGRKEGSQGYMIWNDAVPSGRSGVVTAHVPGKVYWSVHVLEASFSAPLTDEVMGCQDGCGAIVDTGSTLLGVDTPMYDRIFAYVQSLNTDCSDLSVFPSLKLKVGDGYLVLPPQAYIAAVALGDYQQVLAALHSQRTSPFRNSRMLLNGQLALCQLMVVDVGEEQTQFGPQMIIGMEVFRQYYVTFDMGSGQDDRTIYFSEKNDQCDAVSSEEAAMSLDSRSGRHLQPKVLDVSKIRAPRALPTQL